MNQFSFGGAWSKGTGMFAGAAAGHAIILIGVGIIVPFVLQLLVVGGPMSMNPAMMMGGAGGAGPGALMALGATMLVVALANYVLQIGSYFGSWRLGLGAGDNVSGSIIYGLVAALVFILCFVVLAVVMVLVIGGAGYSGGGAAAGGAAIFMLLLMIPLMVLFAILYTAIMAMICVGGFLMLLLMLAFGAGSLGQVDPSLAMLGGGAVVVLILLIVLGLLFWLTARLSCVAPYMAHRKTYNLFEAIGASWRRTADAQWRILGYLALLGIVLLVLFFVAGMVGMASMVGSMTGGGVPEVGMGAMIIGLIVSIPIAYLMVLVPAGIYRELGGGDDVAAEVFA